MILKWFPPKEFYKLSVSVKKKSWSFPYFCKSYYQRKIETFLWATLYIYMKALITSATSFSLIKIWDGRRGLYFSEELLNASHFIIALVLIFPTHKFSFPIAMCRYFIKLIYIIQNFAVFPSLPSRPQYLSMKQIVNVLVNKATCEKNLLQCFI